MSQSAEKRIAQLRKELDHANHLYYIEARPSISDREYDRFMQELIDLETAHPDLITRDSPTQRVGGDVQTELRPVRHAVPMMSIDNTYSEAEVRAFNERVRKALGAVQPAYVLEPKIDGTSISLRYEHGKLVLGATRGRGNVGDDVTVNARTIRSIPFTLKTDGAPIPPPAILEVRGEVYMDNEDFQRVNKEIEAAGDEPYANPRNLTAGTLRRLDPKIVAKRRLRFLAHGLGEVKPKTATGYWEWTQLLRQWGLPLPKEVYQVANVDEAIDKIHAFEAIRPKLPYMTDGIVMKVDAFAQRDKLGATSKSPRWLIAYKYETEQQPTVLKDVRWQVGKGGTLTPVGDLEPVFIGGVTVTHVTLHNIDQIRRLELRYGDTVVIERAGEVIPYVVSVIAEKRPKGARIVHPPKVCPSCGTEVVQPADTPQIRCPNFDCAAQLRERLSWFAGRSQMDVDGLGEKLIDQLIEAGHVKDFADLYRLKAEQIAELVRDVQVGEKKAQEIVDGIDAVRARWPDAVRSLGTRPDEDLVGKLRRLAKELGIKGLGEKTIDQLVEARLVRSTEDLLDVRPEPIAELTQQVKVGEKSAEKLIRNIEASKSRGLARVLAALGIRLVGSTASTAFAAWAGGARKLEAASLEDLAAVLAKNPDAQRESERKEREQATALYARLHDTTEGASLFETGKRSAAPLGETATEAFLLKLDEGLPRASRLGKARSRKLAECLADTSELEAATAEELLDCLLEGRAVARSLHEYLHSERGARVLRDLESVGVRLSAEATKVEESEWTGETVVITGSFEAASRGKLKERLTALGAKVTESVSLNTDAVFVGTDPGSKHDKAVALGLTIHGEDVVRKVMEA